MASPDEELSKALKHQVILSFNENEKDTVGTTQTPQRTSLSGSSELVSSHLKAHGHEIRPHQVTVRSQSIVPPETIDSTLQSEISIDMATIDWRLCQKSYDLGYLDTAIEYLMNELVKILLGSAAWNAWMNNLGALYWTRFRRLGRQSDLESATRSVEQAYMFTPNNHPTKPSLLNNLGTICRFLFETFGELEYLDKAVSYLELAIALTSERNPAKPAYLNNLGNTYRLLFEKIQRHDDMKKMAECLRFSVELTPDGHSEKPFRLYSLGIAHELLFRTFGRHDDLERANDCLNLVVFSMDTGSSEPPSELTCLTGSYKLPSPSTVYLAYGAATDVWRVFGVLSGTQRVRKVFRINSERLIKNKTRSRSKRGHDLWSEFVQEFRDKVEVWKDFSHPNVARIHSSGLTMEIEVDFYELGCVRDFLKSSKSPVNKLSMIRDTVAGVEYLHSRTPPVVHGNLNAGKIFATSNGTVVVGEFGLAALCRPLAGYVPSITCMNFSRWFSPELLATDADQKVEQTAASDVWALGCTIYEILSEELPYSGWKHELEVQRQIREGNPPGQLDVKSIDNQSMEPIMSSCWATTPSVRPNLAGLAKQINQLTLSPRVTSSAPDVATSIDDTALDTYDDRNEVTACPNVPIELILDDHLTGRAALNSLGVIHLLSFKTYGRRSDLDEASDYLHQAIALTPDGHPDRPTQLKSLGDTYLTRFETYGGQRDIDTASDCLHQAVALTPDGHPDKPTRLKSFGDTCLVLFRTFGRQSDIDKASECLHQAVALTPDDHPDKPAWLKSLGDACLTLFGAFGRQSDLDKAVECSSQAVALTPDGHPNKPERLNSLGDAYLRLFETCGQQSNVDKAADCCRLAVELTPDNHPDKPARLDSLGAAHMLLFKTSGRLEDLNIAVECFNTAVLLTPDGHPDKASSLYHLGSAQWQSHQHLQASNDAIKALNAYRSSALMITGLVSTRLLAAQMWATLSSHLKLSSIEAYTRSMWLLSEAVLIGGPVQSGYTHLKAGARGLVAKAVAAAISMKQYDTAVEWLDQGRCIAWNWLLELRTPLDKLRDYHPSLADDLQRVSHLLERAPMSSSDQETFDTAQVHRRWATERGQLIESIRQLAAFEDFLRPPKAAKLVSWVHTNAAVFINMASERCDALVIRSSTHSIEHVPLPDFSYDQAVKARVELVTRRRCRGLVKAKTNPEVSIEQTLSLLWRGVVHPILTHLGIMRMLPADQLPHITWCVTGPLSFLPIHAAGDYSTGLPDTILHNLAVSSYAPNLRVLGRSVTSEKSFSGMLVVGVSPSVRNAPPLSHVKRELEGIHKQFETVKCARLDNQNACVDAVVHAMTDHTWAHFACPASQNRSDPLQSAFQLYDTDLNLAAISRIHLPHAEFAFLSACDTAVGDTELPDEALHLAAGLLVAGFKSVIATMWSISDQHAPMVAEKVYEHMLEGGIPDSRKAAIALHKAMAYLRDSVGTEKYDIWVPYVHMGY